MTDQKTTNRNKILALFPNSIPYIKDLQPLCGHSILACILMQQLDFWFKQQPDGFYKFLDIVPDKIDLVTGHTSKGHALYRAGDSWCEELCCSPDEFRSAFSKIGVRYTSLSDYRRQVGDKFQGKFYLSFLDKKTNVTEYRRNHDVLDAAIDNLVNGNNSTLENPSTDVEGATLRKGEYPPADTKNSGLLRLVNPSTDIRKVELHKTENKTENISNITTENIIHKIEPERELAHSSSPTNMISEKPKTVQQAGAVDNLDESYETDKTLRHHDPKTGVWLENEKDLELNSLLVDRYGIEKVKAAAANALIQFGRAYASKVAKNLAPKGLDRFAKVTLSKWNLDGKDYSRPVRSDLQKVGMSPEDKYKF